MENTNTGTSCSLREEMIDTLKIQILTPSGFQPFYGIKKYWHDQSLKFTFNDDTIVESAYDHRFIVDGKEVFARDVSVGDNIGKIVKDVTSITEGDYFYDPVNVANGKIYNHDNGLVSHNTFFGTGDTLINAQTLLSQVAQPHSEVLEGGNLLIYERPNIKHNYVMCVDVAKGRGQDYSTFNLIDISQRPFKQVAVYRCNTISPILYPNIIYKYATLYNEAYVIIESNDQGSLVTNGLYQDLEYENLHMQSFIKADSIGVEMSRKVKRIGCAAIKDIIEHGKLNVVDPQTILEMSTFVAKGVSYEASEGNHDDLMMNLVLFGYFAVGNNFEELTDVNLKEMMFDQRMKEIEDDMVPFGFIEDGMDGILSPMELQNEEDPWIIADEKRHSEFNFKIL